MPVAKFLRVIILVVESLKRRHACHVSRKVVLWFILSSFMDKIKIVSVLFVISKHSSKLLAYAVNVDIFFITSV
jgi:hypothetical protein